jgi:hypothetical protein
MSTIITHVLIRTTTVVTRSIQFYGSVRLSWCSLTACAVLRIHKVYMTWEGESMSCCRQSSQQYLVMFTCAPWNTTSSLNCITLLSITWCNSSNNGRDVEESGIWGWCNNYTRPFLHCYDAISVGLTRQIKWRNVSGYTGLGWGCNTELHTRGLEPSGQYGLVPRVNQS